jgi:hypothetical protein
MQDSLKGQRILLCLTGSVAGIKAGELVAGLEAAGAHVKLAATVKGKVFLDRSQVEMPASFPGDIHTEDHDSVSFARRVFLRPPAHLRASC